MTGTIIWAHDHCRRLKKDTFIGENCVIGVNSIIMPGVTIGESTVIGAGSIVTKNLPGYCIAVGNPAKVVRVGIKVVRGQIVDDGFK